MKKFTIFFSLFILTAAAAYPFGRGGGAGRGGNGGNGRNGNFQQGQQGGNQNGGGETNRYQKRINSQQRKQLGECSGIADGIRTQARTMSRNGGKNFNTDNARQQFSRIRERLQTMDKQHSRLMQGLSAEQQQAFQKNIREMNRLQLQLNNQLREMDSELAPANPDAKKVTDRARKIERTMNDWKKQYNTIEDQSE
jgi:predicted  nucleic acid-binding Zn-ribbon protein